MHLTLASRPPVLRTRCSDVGTLLILAASLKDDETQNHSQSTSYVCDMVVRRLDEIALTHVCRGQNSIVDRLGLESGLWESSSWRVDWCSNPRNCTSCDVGSPRYVLPMHKSSKFSIVCIVLISPRSCLVSPGPVGHNKNRKNQTSRLNNWIMKRSTWTVKPNVLLKVPVCPRSPTNGLAYLADDQITCDIRTVT